MVRATSISRYFPTILAASKHFLRQTRSAGRNGPRSGLQEPRSLLRRHRCADLADDKPQRAGADMYRRAVGNAAFEDLLRQRVLQFALDDALQRPRAIDRV